MEAGRPILIVDDEQDVLDFSAGILEREGYDVTRAMSEKEAISLLKKNEYMLVITDRNMETRDSGLNVLRWVRENRPDSGVMIVTSYAEVANAVEAMKNGAMDYVEKPFNFEAFRMKVRNVLERLELSRDHKKHVEIYNIQENEIIGSSEAIRKVIELADIYAGSEGSVLVTGETGSGKELIARRIHSASTRKDKLFVECNAGAIGKDMIRSDLFGHVKGAFTGAISNRTGKFELADGGTIFLDEIGEMDIDCQTYLLRVLETGKIERMGDTGTRDVDVRVVAGTNRDLHRAIEEGSFREDLYYRLAQLPVEVPPLRERREDIVLIAKYFLKIEGEVMGKPLKLSKEAEKKLRSFSWPGNVRMLKNHVHLASVLAVHRGMNEIGAEYIDLPAGRVASRALDLKEESTLDRYHSEILDQLLSRNSGNKRQVARVLGVTEATIHNWIKKF